MKIALLLLVLAFLSFAAGILEIISLADAILICVICLMACVGIYLLIRIKEVF